MYLSRTFFLWKITKKNNNNKQSVHSTEILVDDRCVVFAHVPRTSDLGGSCVVWFSSVYEKENSLWTCGNLKNEAFLLFKRKCTLFFMFWLKNNILFFNSQVRPSNVSNVTRTTTADVHWQYHLMRWVHEFNEKLNDNNFKNSSQSTAVNTNAESNTHSVGRPHKLSSFLSIIVRKFFFYLRNLVNFIKTSSITVPPDSRVIRGCGWDDTSFKGRCYQRSGFGGRQEVCACYEDNCNSASSVSLGFGLIVASFVVIYGLF